MSRRRWEGWSGALCILAGVAHGGLAPSHFAEWWGYGLFFATAAAAQVLLGLALLLDAFDDEPARRAMYLGGAIGNALVLALYVVTRTVGVPFAGPAQGEVEGVDAIGVATGALEVGAVALLFVLLRRR